jgi:tRNA1Val (adenine37-N6)-methyltransferase
MPRRDIHVPLPDIDEPVTLDRISGDWHIHQLAKGHRFSTDDLVTAWLAIEHHPAPVRHLDLGTGIGSVGTMVLWHRLGRPDTEEGRPRTTPDHPRPLMVGIEAQEVSHRLNRHTLRHNELEDVVELRHSDFRAPSALPQAEYGTYDLVTGSPPYIPLGKGVVSPHHQRAACRMELRGDVFDYCQVAVRALAPDGILCLCHAWDDPRPEAAMAEAGLTIRDRRDVFFRRNREPTIVVWAAGFGGQREDGPPIVVRESDGRMTEQYLRLRRFMGAPEWRPRANRPA